MAGDRDTDRKTSQFSETGQGGVPWDIGTLAAVRADLTTKDMLGNKPITQDEFVAIISKGNEVPYTQQARSIFAANAIIRLSSRDGDSTTEDLIDAAVSTTLRRLGISKR